MVGKATLDIIFRDRSANAMDNSSLSIGWLTIDSTPPVRSMEDNSDIGAGGDNITNINTSIFIGSSEAHATIKLTIDTQPSAEPTLGSTVNSLDNTVTLKGVVEAHQDIQVKVTVTVTVNDTDYTASGTFTGTSPTENPVNKSSGVDEMISLSEATWHSVSVDEEYYA